MDKKPLPKTKSHRFGFIRDLAYAFLAVLVINSFVLASFEVPTGSMEDTVKIGDRLFVNKFGDQRVHIIVFHWPETRIREKPALVYLKRASGCGGIVQIEHRVVTVNGKPHCRPVSFRENPPADTQSFRVPQRRGFNEIISAQSSSPRKE
jgi:signal peptidase I